MNLSNEADIGETFLTAGFGLNSISVILLTGIQPLPD